MESDNEAPESISLHTAKEAALRHQTSIRETLQKEKDARKQRLREMALKAMPSLNVDEQSKKAEESSPIVRRTFKLQPADDEDHEEDEEGFIRLDKVKLVAEDVRGWKQRLLMQRPGRIETWRDRMIRKTASRK